MTERAHDQILPRILPFILGLMLLTASAVCTGYAQTPILDDAALQENVPIEFELKRVGRIELISIQRDNQVFIPLQQLFDFLKIKHEFDPVANTISGFLVSADTPYVVDASNGKIRVGKRSGDLNVNDFVARDTEIYLRVELFDRYFGLPINYKPRQLGAILSTNMQLPVFLDRQLMKIENEFDQRVRPDEPEYFIDRPIRIIDGMRLDYVLRQGINTTSTPVTSFFTRVAGHALGGDVEARFNGILFPEADITQTRAFWRFVPPNERAQSKLFRQLTIGDFITNGIQPREGYGVEITNRPPYPRIYFADEYFAGQTVGDRNIYYYNNFRLEQYQPPDTAGRYEFDRVLRYGVNYVEIRQYNEWGEMFGDTYRIFVPQAMVPPKDVEYTLSAARIRDIKYHPWYGEGGFQWGISSRITAGARIEYYDNEELTTNVFPTLNAVVRISSHLNGSVIFSPNAFNRGILEMTLPSLIDGVVTYTDYQPVRLFNPRLAINELNAALSVPFSVGQSRFSISFGGTQTIFDQSRQRTALIGASAYIGTVFPRIFTRMGWNHSYTTGQNTLTFHETEPAIRFRLPANLYLQFATRYDHLESEFIDARIGAILQPRSNLTFEFSYDKGFRFDNDVLRFRLQWILPYTRVTGTATSYERRNTFYSLAVSGSIGFNPQHGDFFFENNSGRATFGGILVAPFLDANNNGMRDQGEETLRLASVRATRLADAEGFSFTEYPGIGWGTTRAVPYQHYVIEIERTGFENPLWVPRHSVVEVSTAPGRFSYYELPVLLGGAVRGSVVIGEALQNQYGVEGIRVNIREVGAIDTRVAFEATVETFSNGDFEIIAVPPGTYEVSLDGRQLSTAGLSTSTFLRTVTVEPQRDGDVIEDVSFQLIEVEQ